VSYNRITDVIPELCGVLSVDIKITGYWLPSAKIASKIAPRVYGPFSAFHPTNVRLSYLHSSMDYLLSANMLHSFPVHNLAFIFRIARNK
jgi:hypothetical protein